MIMSNMGFDDAMDDRRQTMAEFGSLFVGPNQLCELIRQLEEKLMECWADYWDGGTGGPDNGPLPEGAIVTKWLGAFRCRYQFFEEADERFTYGDYFTVQARDNQGYMRTLRIFHDHVRDVHGCEVVNRTIEIGAVPGLEVRA